MDYRLAELFPAFHPDALVELLPKLGGDAMDALFVPGFAIGVAIARRRENRPPLRLRR